MLRDVTRRPLVGFVAVAALVVGPMVLPAAGDDGAPDQEPTPAPTAEPAPAEPGPAETSAPPADPAPSGPVAPPVGGYGETNVTQPPSLVRVLPTRCTGRDQVMPSVPQACRVTRYRNRPTVVVWGDSHSWQQTPAIAAAARRTRTNLVTFQMGACPPMDLRGTRFAVRGCGRMGAAALAYIKDATRNRREVSVVAGGAWSLYRDVNARLASGWTPAADEVYLASQASISTDGIPRAFRTLDRMPRVRVFGISQMPIVGDNAATCPSGTGCDLSRTDAIHREASVASWLRARVDQTVDSTGYVCDRSTCFANVAERRTFLDKLHLDPAIAPRFTPAYRPVFAR